MYFGSSPINEDWKRSTGDVASDVTISRVDRQALQQQYAGKQPPARIHKQKQPRSRIASKRRDQPEDGDDRQREQRHRASGTVAPRLTSTR
jgi:hypothetical protein